MQPTICETPSALPRKGFRECGQSQDRTGDPTLFRRVLYRLSYLARTTRLPSNSATLTGLEPATSAVTGRRANQLRHRAIFSCLMPAPARFTLSLARVDTLHRPVTLLQIACVGKVMPRFEARVRGHHLPTRETSARLCSTTMSVAPVSTSLSNKSTRRAVSVRCRPSRRSMSAACRPAGACRRRRWRR